MQKKHFISFLFAFCLFVAGCVPSPSASDTVPPKFTELHSFFIQQSTNKSYLWHYVPLAPKQDSFFSIEYFGLGAGQTVEGFSPVSIFEYADTSKKIASDKEAYISDSLVKFYFGRSADPSTQRQILLRDTLRVGASWISAENFITSNGAEVSIKALVDNYFSETSSNGKIYKDVFVVSYTSSVKSAQSPVEPEYQNGAHLNVYYAKDIGPILEKCKNSKDSVVWTKELVETRIR